MNKIITIICVLCLTLAACSNHNLVDTNASMSDHNWTYATSIHTPFEIKDSTKPYQVYFKLRHTDQYRYANLFVLFNLKGKGLNKQLRYQFKLAKGDGTWTGKGSGVIFTHNFILLKNYRFPKAGTYTIDIEQNMRDNPLVGISDVGLTVSGAQLKD